MMLQIGRQENAQAPYLGEFIVECFFSVIDEWPEEKLIPLVSINAPSILYASIREMLMTISHRFSQGHVLLPSMSFSDVPKTWVSDDTGSDETKPNHLEDGSPIVDHPKQGKNESN